MSFKHKFLDRQQPTHQLLPAGKYRAEIVEATFGMSQRNIPKVDLKLEESETGATFYETVSFAEAAGWRMDTMLVSAGVAPKKGEEITINKKLLEGQTVFVELDVEKYTYQKKDENGTPVGSPEDRQKNVVKNWLPPFNEDSPVIASDAEDSADEEEEDVPF